MVLCTSFSLSSLIESSLMLIFTAEFILTLYAMKYKIMFLFKLNSFLKDIEVKDKRSLDWRQTIDTEYDILNLWNLPKGLGLKVKIGSFSANTAQHQQLSLSEEMIQWPEGFLDVSYVFNQCFVVMLIINVYFLIQLHLFSD